MLKRGHQMVHSAKLIVIALLRSSTFDTELPRDESGDTDFLNNEYEYNPLTAGTKLNDVKRTELLLNCVGFKNFLVTDAPDFFS